MSEHVPIVRIASRGEGMTEDGRHSPLSAPGDLLAIDGTLIHGPHHVDPPCHPGATTVPCMLGGVNMPS